MNLFNRFKNKYRNEGRNSVLNEVFANMIAMKRARGIESTTVEMDSEFADALSMLIMRHKIFPRDNYSYFGYTITKTTK